MPALPINSCSPTLRAGATEAVSPGDLRRAEHIESGRPFRVILSHRGRTLAGAALEVNGARPFNHGSDTRQHTVNQKTEADSFVHGGQYDAAQQ